MYPLITHGEQDAILVQCVCVYVILFLIREAKLQGNSNLKRVVPELGAVLSVHSNSNGSKISVIAEQVSGRGFVSAMPTFTSCVLCVLG